MAHPHQQHYRSPFGDTTLTKVFVGGLAWETPTDVMRSYFQQFGDILEAVIITDKNTAKSKGYGFVTFRDPESARRACADPNPMIDGRRANCNIASLGRPRPSPPRGRNQAPNLYQGSAGIAQGGLSSYLTLPPPPAPPMPPLIYPPYGYTSYSPEYAYQQQTMYNPHVQQTQYYNQVYGASSSALGSPYYYGYSPRGTFSMATAQRLPGPSYLYYPTQVESTSLTYPPTPLPLPSLQPIRHSLPSSAEIAADLSAPPQTSTETEAGPATSTSSTA